MLKIKTFLTILFSISFMAGCSSLPKASVIPVANTEHTIYFVYRNWHTSIIVDAKQLAMQSPKLAADIRGEKFARIGWGDGDYFTGKSKTWGTAATALVASQYSALQLLTYDEHFLNEIPPETLVPLAISDAGLKQLIRYIDASIAVDEKNIALKLQTYIADTGVFFKATEQYSFFSNCNTWSGQALRLAGLPIANRLTAKGIFAQAQEISRVQVQAGLMSRLVKR
ncbi:MAG: DUF2459 domain-containing protein [Pseudomonadota bacterium]